jgi:Ca2+/Na+ antiporter
MPDVLTRLSEWTNSRRKLVWLMLFGLVAAVIVVVATPVFLIMPFKSQTPRIVEISYVMRRWSPFLTVVASSNNATAIIPPMQTDKRNLALIMTISSPYHARLATHPGHL